MKLLYSSLVLPYLNYCNAIWANTYKTKLQPIVLLQKRLVRIICNVHKYELFLELGILKFFDIIELNTLSIMYHVKHDLLPINLQQYFKIGNVHCQYVTRAK